MKRAVMCVREDAIELYVEANGVVTDKYTFDPHTVIIHRQSVSFEYVPPKQPEQEKTPTLVQ